MALRLFFGGLLMSTVWTSVAMEEMTRKYDCCHLPFEIKLNRSHEHEIFIGKETLATATPSSFDAKDPFTRRGNDTLTVNECVDFVHKIFYDNEFGEADEMVIHNRGQPCNRTVPDNGPVQNIFIGIGVPVLLFLVGGIVAIVWFCTRNGNNGVV